MAQAHATRWIIEMRIGSKWVRSGNYPDPFFTKKEADAALAVAQSFGNDTDITYRLRQK